MNIDRLAQWVLALIMFGVIISINALKQQVNAIDARIQPTEYGFIDEEPPTHPITLPSQQAKQLSEKRLHDIVITAINSTLDKRMKDTNGSIAETHQVPSIQITPEQYQSRLEQISSITESGYLDLDAVKQIQDAMKHMDQQQTEESLSQIFTALNDGRLSIEPGVIL